MRFLIAVMLFSLLGFSGIAGVQRTGLKAAMKAGLVKVTASSTGASYRGKALQLHVINTTREAVLLTVEPALIFQPADTSYQDLVLPGDEILVLAPGAHGELVVQTFCGKAHASAPLSKLNYVFKGQGDSAMIKVLNYVHAHKLFDNLGQQAVWALTDFHTLEAVFDVDRPKESNELVAMLVKLTGGRTPDYFKIYKLDTTAGQPVFVKRLLKIVAVLEWKLPEPKALTLGIYNSTGDLVQGVFEEKQLAKGGYKMDVQFEAEGAPQGKYFLRLKDGDILMKEITVNVE